MQASAARDATTAAALTQGSGGGTTTNTTTRADPPGVDITRGGASVSVFDRPVDGPRGKCCVDPIRIQSSLLSQPREIWSCLSFPLKCFTPPLSTLPRWARRKNTMYFLSCPFYYPTRNRNKALVLGEEVGWNSFLNFHSIAKISLSDTPVRRAIWMISQMFTLPLSPYPSAQSQLKAEIWHTDVEF